MAICTSIIASAGTGYDPGLILDALRSLSTPCVELSSRSDEDWACDYLCISIDCAYVAAVLKSRVLSQWRWRSPFPRDMSFPERAFLQVFDGRLPPDYALVAEDLHRW